MKPLVSQLWPQFMADPDFAACFGKVVVEHALMLRARQKVIFTLQSAAPLDKGLCARLLASLQPDYEGYQLSIENHYPYTALNEETLLGIFEEMKADGSLYYVEGDTAHYIAPQDWTISDGWFIAPAGYEDATFIIDGQNSVLDGERVTVKEN